MHQMHLGFKMNILLKHAKIAIKYYKQQKHTQLSEMIRLSSNSMLVSGKQRKTTNLPYYFWLLVAFVVQLWH